MIVTEIELFPTVPNRYYLVRIRGAICVAGQRYDEELMDITRDDVDMSNMRKLVPLLNDQIR